MDTSTDRRRFLRSVFHAPVRLSLGGRDSQAWLHDISLRGALVEVGADWTGRVGAPCRLWLDAGQRRGDPMETTVAHIDDRHVGLHCDHIDLDSMTHLRQLVEHNAEDPALLERELGMLVAHAARVVSQ